jgi:2-amino-4-hydroxy-6-hydroxymethyldihydropteridine diphosphokinase
MTFRYYIGLGSNIGPRLGYLKKAVVALRELGTVGQKSHIYETEPWGDIQQQKYLNAAVVLDTSLTPQDLLVEIKDIEQRLGRTPGRRWGPREIDIDIIWSDAPEINESNLQVPHKYLEQRRFVLEPLSEFSDTLQLHNQEEKISDLLRICNDKSTIDKINLNW